MEKRVLKPGAMLAPAPAVMVSCGDMQTSDPEKDTEANLRFCFTEYKRVK